MKRLATAVVVVGVTASLGALSLQPDGDPARCSISVLNPASLTRGSTLARVVALSDTVRVETSPQELTEILRRVREDSIGTAWGQRFRVEALHGEIGVLAVADSITVVPWMYWADCSLMPWTESRRWVAPGTEVVFRFAAATAREDGKTFDVLGQHWPYPTGAFLRYEGYRSRPGPTETWLSATDFFDLVSQLPAFDWDESDPDSVLSAVRDLYERTPVFGEAFPGDLILQQYERLAGRRLPSPW